MSPEWLHFLDCLFIRKFLIEIVQKKISHNLFLNVDNLIGKVFAGLSFLSAVYVSGFYGVVVLHTHSCIDAKIRKERLK